MEIVRGKISDLKPGDFFLPADQVDEELLREHILDMPLIMGYFYTGTAWGEDVPVDDEILIIRPEVG